MKYRAPISLRRLSAGAAALAGALVLSMLSSSAAPKPLTLVYSTPGLQFPFFVFQSHFVEAAAGKVGGVKIIVDDGQNSATKQTADVEAAVAQHVDGIIISPITVTTLVPALKEAAAKNVPIVTIDREATGAPTLAHVGADNVAVGRVAAQFVVKQLGGKGTVVLLTGTPGASAAIDRTTGIMEVFKKAPGINVAFNQTAQFDRATAITVTEAALNKLPHIDAIVCENDDMALGAALALKNKNLTGKVIVTGADAIPDAVRAISDGSMTASVEQFGDKQAYEDVQILTQYLRDGKKPSKHDNFIEPALITKANLSEAVVKK